MLRGNNLGYEVCPVDVAQVLDWLQEWYDSCLNDYSLENDLRLSMLEGFEDMILNAIVEDY